MFIVHVFIQTIPGRNAEFQRATLENAKHSLREPGIARFDFLAQADDPNRFALVEVYRTPEDAAKHKETPHYKTWRDTVADMMAQPRSSTKYANIVPDDSGWESPKTP